MTQQPLFKSEVFVPIRKDSKTFEDRQRNLWNDAHSGRSKVFEDMQKRMELRRMEWEHEVDRMRKDFFRLKPPDMRKGSSENLLDSMRLDDIFTDTTQGDKKFRVSFDVSQFRPEEISVRTEESKLLVKARHEEKGEGTNMSREFSRQIDVPKHVDPQKLTCTLSKDGILQVEADVPAPAYDQIRAAAPAEIHPAVPSYEQVRSVSNTPLHDLPQPRAMSDYRSSPVLKEEEGSKSLKMEVEIGSEFLPEEIQVKTVDRKLLVSARHEEREAGRTSVREFSREFDLPAEVDPNTVTASMTPENGKLIIEAPLASYQEGAYEGNPGSTKRPTVTVQLR